MPRVIDPKLWPTKGGGLRAFCPGFWTQGATDLSQCRAFAAAPTFSAVFNYQFKDKSSPVSFSAPYIYATGIRSTPGSDGLGNKALLESLRGNGACLRTTIGEHDFNYAGYAQSVFQEAMRYRCDPDSGYEFFTWGELVSACLSRFGIVAGFYKGTRFHWNAGGYVEDFKGDTEQPHAVAAIGEYEVRHGREYIWCNMGEGPKYGRDGYLAIARSYFEPRGLQALGGVALVSGLKG